MANAFFEEVIQVEEPPGGTGWKGMFKRATTQLRRFFQRDSHETRATSRHTRSPTQEKQREVIRKYMFQLRKALNGQTADERDNHDTAISGTAYIVEADVQQILTREALHELLSPLSWFKKKHLDDCYHHFLLIIAILIIIGWQDWEHFNSLFLDRKENERQNRDIPWAVHDGLLPLRFCDLKFLEVAQTSFDQMQYIFKPVVFQEGKYCTFYKRQRLPICLERPLSPLNDSRSVTEILVDRFSLQTFQGDHPPKPTDLNSNMKRKWLAKKTFFDKSRFDVEWGVFKEHLETFSESKSSHHQPVALCFPVASFEHDGKWSILYERADVDLHTFFSGQFSTFMNRANSYTPSLIIDQCRKLADGLKYMHIDGWWHCDLKLENILVYFDWGDGNGIGDWKLNDFGISSKPKSLITDESRLRTGVAARERSSVPMPRPEGTFQPPEAHLKNGKATAKSGTDMWSFGCILCIALAFILNGWRGVREFEAIRKEIGAKEEPPYKNDWFWTYRNDTPVVKQNVLDWLASVSDCSDPTKKQYNVNRWIDDAVSLIRRLLVVERNKRETAEIASKELRDIYAKLSGNGRKDLRKGLKVGQGTIERLWLCDEPEKDFSSENSEIAQSSSSQTRASISAEYEGPPNLTFEWRTSSRFPAVSDATDCKITPDGNIVSFHNNTTINLFYIYKLWIDGMVDVDINQLDGTTSAYSHTRTYMTRPGWKIHGQSIADAYLVVHEENVGSSQQQMVFLSLEDNSTPSPKILKVHSLKNGELIRGFQVSSQGDLAFYRDAEMHFLPLREESDAGREPIPLPPGVDVHTNTPVTPVMKSLAFSKDGKLLCIWYESHIQIWRTFSIRDDTIISQDQYYDQSPLINAAGAHPLLWPFSAVYTKGKQESCFIALDAAGYGWIHNDLDPNYPELRHDDGVDEFTNNSLHGVHAIAAFPEANAVLSLQKIYFNSGARVCMLQPERQIEQNSLPFRTQHVTRNTVVQWSAKCKEIVCLESIQDLSGFGFAARSDNETIQFTIVSPRGELSCYRYSHARNTPSRTISNT